MPVVTLDAFDTLIALEPPVPHLVAALDGIGRPHPAGQVAAAFAAEVAYYRANHMRGADPNSLDALRRDSARQLAAGLDDPPSIDALVEIMLASLRFRLFADVPAALARLEAAGARLAVVSNWDCSLERILVGLGIARRFETIVVSAEIGEAKPSPAPFLAALGDMGVEPSREVVHCGDSPEADGSGALAAGLRAVIIDREGAGGGGGYPCIRRLPDLAEVL